jgi:hypothetical protein
VAHPCLVRKAVDAAAVFSAAAAASVATASAAAASAYSAVTQTKRIGLGSI